MIRFIVKLFKILFILAIWAAAGAGAAYYFGSQPDVTYYPDGKTKSSVSRKWFIPNGSASYYRPDGTLSRQCTFVDGKQTGEATIYFAGQPVKTRYQDGQLTGAADFGNIAFLKDKPVPSVTFLPNRGLELVFAQDDMRLQLKANRVCADDSLIARLQAYADTLDKKQLKLVLECLKLQNLSWDQNQASCHMQGEYLYPALASDISVSCDVPYDNQDLLTGIEILSVQGSYVLDQDKLSFDIFDPHKSTSKFFVSYRGIAPIVKSISETLINENADDYVPNILTAILQNLTSSDAYVMLNNQKIWDISGDFNLMNGFSDPYYISSYMDQQITSQWKVTSSGINLKVLYPVSKKPMLLFGLNVDESFKENYHTLMQDIINVLAENIHINDGESTEQKVLSNDISSFADDASDLLKNVYATLYNNKGQKVLSGIMSFKKNADEQELLGSPLTAFTGNVTLYDNNRPIHQIAGDFEKGFTVDGQIASQEDVFNLVGSPEVLQVFADIGEELDTKFGPIVDNGQLLDATTPVDPFLFGLYLGYSHAKVDPNISVLRNQIATIADNIQSLYADAESYAGLTDDIAIEYDAVPIDMAEHDDDHIRNVYGGIVTISIDAASSDGYDDEAFILTITNLPQEACTALASHDWFEDNEGFIGVAAVPTGVADVSLAYTDQSFQGRPAGTVYTRTEAKNACGQTGTSSVALKFY